MVQRFRQRHVRLYIGVGNAAWSKLLERAGLQAHKDQLWLTRQQAKRLLTYHFVMVAERKPPRWKKNSRWQATRDKPRVEKPLRRSVHLHLPTLERQR